MIAMKKQGGFTLVELMVAVALVAILTRIAYVAYTKQTIKGNRNAAESGLLQMAQAQERWYSTHDVYTSNASSLAFTYWPQTGTSIYTLAVVSGSASSTAFLLRATPKSGTINSSDGSLTLKSDGSQCWYKGGGSTCQSWTSN